MKLSSFFALSCTVALAIVVLFSMIFYLCRISGNNNKPYRIQGKCSSPERKNSKNSQWFS